MKIIKAKMKGKKVKLEEPEERRRTAGVLDLMSRLRASLEQGSGEEGPVRAEATSAAAKRARRTAKRKTA